VLHLRESLHARPGQLEIEIAGDPLARPRWSARTARSIIRLLPGLMCGARRSRRPGAIGAPAGRSTGRSRVTLTLREVEQAGVTAGRLTSPVISLTGPRPARAIARRRRPPGCPLTSCTDFARPAMRRRTCATPLSCAAAGCCRGFLPLLRRGHGTEHLPEPDDLVYLPSAVSQEIYARASANPRRSAPHARLAAAVRGRTSRTPIFACRVVRGGVSARKSPW